MSVMDSQENIASGWPRKLRVGRVARAALTVGILGALALIFGLNEDRRARQLS